MAHLHPLGGLMGAPRHPPERKAQALGALYLSAEVVDSDLIPNFRAVESRIKVDQNTLIRWWNQRDRSQDGPARDLALRARDEAMGQGAATMVRKTAELAIQRVTELLTDETRFKKADYDEAARACRNGLAALKDGLELIKVISDRDQPEAQTLDANVQAALKRVPPKISQGAEVPRSQS